MEEEAQKQYKKQYDWLKQYQFQKGQSGNPGGSKKGKRMKTFARELLEGMTDEEKAEWLKTQDPDFVWKMAEGMPDTKTDFNNTGNPIIVISNEIAKKYDTSSEPSKDSQ